MPQKWPLRISRGSASVRIYRVDNHGYPSFVLDYYLAGKRVRKTFADSQRAKTEAEVVATALANGTGDALALTGADRDSYLHAMQLLAPLCMPLHAAIEEFVQARQIANGISLVDAAREYSDRHTRQLRTASISQILQECLERKRRDGLSEKYLTQFKSDLSRFAAAFQKPVADIRTAEIEEWLHSLNVAARTRNNLATSIATLFSYCKKQGYLPKHLPTEAEEIGRAKIRGGKIEIFTPEEMALLINDADNEMIPFIALGGFAGLRSGEIQRLAWEDIRFDAGVIEVDAKKAKTAARRLTPIAENLRMWLLPLRHSAGLVLPRSEIWRRVTEKARGLRIGWSQNVLRHSAISYRLAETHDVNRTALECGTSSAMIFRHYRELATEDDAAKWWAIRPARSEGIATETQQ